METTILIITSVSFLIPIIATTVNPFSFQKDATENAKKRGWNNSIILITRALPYLTLYTQFWTILALFYLTPILMFIAQSLTLIVFCLYHTFNTVNPTYLTYLPEEFVKEVVSWKPPKVKDSISFGRLVIWTGLHLQHTVFPFYLYYINSKHNIDYTKNLTSVIIGFIVMFVYIIWMLFCWHVQGIPAYPFLIELRSRSQELTFYHIGLMSTLVINCALANLWSQLFFYILGIKSVIVGVVTLNYRSIKT